MDWSKITMDDILRNRNNARTALGKEFKIAFKDRMNEREIKTYANDLSWCDRCARKALNLMKSLNQ